MSREDIEDLFSGIGTVVARRQFGGFGVFKGETMFAIVHDGEVYLRCPGALGERLEALGCAAFTYRRQGREIALGYRCLPASALDDPEEAARWAREALRAR